MLDIHLENVKHLLENLWSEGTIMFSFSRKDQTVIYFTLLSAVHESFNCSSRAHVLFHSKYFFFQF